MTNKLFTKWGEYLDKSKVLTEYPRPQLVRDSYMCLNGLWQYSINHSIEIPTVYDGTIVVPFSPECVLSGVEHILQPDEYLHYHRSFVLEQDFVKEKVILHFGAVDMFSIVYVNGILAGKNEGGYYAFDIDITRQSKVGENIIDVVVWDYTDTSYYTRSKQQFKRGGIWYTPQSGIWQTVWLESVANNYIENISITPLFDQDKVRIDIIPCGGIEDAVVTIYDGERTYMERLEGTSISISLDNVKEWSPSSPFLYDLRIKCATDEIKSYFGMRKYSIGEYNGKKRLFLNNKPIFMSGVLDQGYWSDGMYTAPSDCALVNDIVKMKELGFNMIRKHIKVEPMRWYYHCDRLGMIVWQDMPSGGEKYSKWVTQILPFVGINLKDKNHKLFGRSKKESRLIFEKELGRMVSQLYNVTSIGMWVIFNEGWGQFDANEKYKQLKFIDKTRIIDHASGWHDQGSGDVRSMHVYYKKIPKVVDKRAIILSEFGGYSCYISDHSFNNKTFGYKVFDNVMALQKGFDELYEEQIIPKINEGLCATVYTQLSDVEDEVNGILTYDRKICKLDVKRTKEINAKLRIE